MPYCSECNLAYTPNYKVVRQPAGPECKDCAHLREYGHCVGEHSGVGDLMVSWGCWTEEPTPCPECGA